MPERVAMNLTGHKTRAVFERYNIVSAGDLLDAVQRLNRYAADMRPTRALDTVNVTSRNLTD